VIDYNPGLVYNGNFSEEDGSDAMYQILLNHPDVRAVFSTSDLMVLVPETLYIVGFDDITIASYCSPKIKTIHQGKYEMGIQAAQMLIDLLENLNINRLENFPKRFDGNVSVLI
jgi:LacI family transcriptional regulator